MAARSATTRASSPSSVRPGSAGPANPVKTVTVACPHCGESRAQKLWSGREHEYEDTTDEVFDFVRCAGCGLVRLNPRPDVSELGRIYPPDYYAYNLLSGEPAE